MTGAARGIGRGAAYRLAREGARVALVDKDEAAVGAAAKAFADDGVPAMPFAIDVTDQAGVKEAVAAVLSTEGRIDVLVNNAGIYPHTPFHELTFEEWRRVLATNPDGVFLCTRAAYPAMVERGYGRIVNVMFDEIVGEQAVKRRGRVEDIVECIAYLAGPAHM